MGQKHKIFRYSRTPFPLRDIRKNPRSMYARVPQAMAQFVLKIEKFSHIMVPTPVLEMARAYGLRPRLWLLPQVNRLVWPRVNRSESKNIDEATGGGAREGTPTTHYFVDFLLSLQFTPVARMLKSCSSGNACYAG